MVQENSERLKKYLDMISRREGGVEGVMHKLAARPREESAEGARPARSGKPATAALESAVRRKDIPERDYADLEAIIFEDIRPAIDIVDGAFTVTHPLWTQLSSDAAIRTRIGQCGTPCSPISSEAHVPPARIDSAATTTCMLP